MAHQWWGLQVAAANVQGQKMLLEALAQYSALMVLEANFPAAKIRQFLKMEEQKYLSGRANTKKQEVPLTLVDDQSYIYYRKGSLNLYALQALISEDSVNVALKRFIRDWNSFDGFCQKERYATTADLMAYFSAVTPDTLQYLLPQLFETITLFDNKIKEVTYEKVATNQYKTAIKLEVKKIEVDSLGVENIVALNDWVDLVIYGEKEEIIYQGKHKITSPLMDLEILVNQPPSKLVLDPDFLQIDKNRKDNVRIIE